LIDISKDFKKPIFIAFYEQNDLNNTEIQFIKNVLEVVNKHHDKVSFYWFKDQVPDELEERFYLHYYTLPKLKFFKGFTHETFIGSKSPIMIEKWFLKKIEVTESVSIEFQDLWDFQVAIQINDRTIIYVGNSESYKIN